MKKNLDKVLKTIAPDTSLDELAQYCDTIEDVEQVLASLPETKNKPAPISDELKQTALKLLKVNNLNAAEITTSYIQRNLHISYPQASVLVDWLQQRI